MALAIQKFLFTISLIGARDVERSKTIEILASGIDDATKRTNAQASAATILSTFQTASNSHVQATSLSEVQFDSVATPGGLGNLYEEVVITANLDVGGGKKASIAIPAPADGLFVGNSGNTDDVDTADADLLAYIAEFANAGGKLGAISDGEQYESPTNVLSGRVRSVRSGKKF